MSQVLDKRTADSRLFDIDCSKLLAAGETITSITSVASAQGGLTFGAGAINGSPITYEDGYVAPAGKVVQVQISGGTIPAGYPSVQCVVRALFATTTSPAVEATVMLRLIDTPNVF